MADHIRAIWLRGRGWRFRIGEARYYGWRYMLSVGPLTICAGRLLDGVEHNGFPA